MYKIIFCDLDGTLLRDDKTISQENLDAIKFLQDNNIEFVICTGRSNLSLNLIEEGLNLKGVDGYNICYNGSLVYNRGSNNIIYNRKIDNSLVFKIIDFCKGYDADLLAYDDFSLICEKTTPSIERYSKLIKITPQIVNYFNDNFNFMPYKIIIIGEEYILKKLQADFNSTPLINDIDCCFSSNFMLEFNLKGVNKATAAKKVMDIMGGGKCIAIGDSFNDLPLLKFADYSVCVKDSPIEIQEACNFVTKYSNNKYVLQEVVEKVLI